MKKYELLSSDMGGMYRVKALRDFGDIKKGDVGGYVAGEHNLSHDGDCWVSGNAWVSADAQVSGNARICGNAWVSGDVRVSGNAWIFGNARVFGNAWVSGDARVSGDAQVSGNAQVSDMAVITADAQVSGNTVVYGNAHVSECASIFGYAMVSGNARICGDARVSCIKDYIVFKNWWSSGRYFTWTRSNDMWRVGCFYGKGEDLIAKAYKDSKESGDNYKAIVEYVENVVK